MKIMRLLSLLISLSLIFGILIIPASATKPDESILPVSGGSGHTIAVTKDGHVYTWGTNRSGQLGIKNVDGSAKPTLVEGISAVAVAAGYDFSVALSYTGTVYVWGMNQDKLPKEINITGVVKIDAGQTDILALRTDGTVWQWTYGNQPKAVQGLERIVDISAGGSHYLALGADGSVYAWGSNTFGQLGDGTTYEKQVPIKVPLLNVVDISAGHTHSLASTYDGKVYAWGNNECGQLGIGTTDNSAVPVCVKNLTKAIKVAAGNGMSMALNENGQVFTWGYGEYGQLGNGSNSISTTVPVSVTNQLPNIIYIECGVQHCLAVTEGGTLYAWGRNRDGQIGNAGNANSDISQRIMSDIYVDGAFRPEIMTGASNWAISDLTTLYDSGKVFPLLWSKYSTPITRGEFASLLVSLYESVKETSVTGGGGVKFTDIENHILESNIRKAIGLGLLNGTSDSTITPDRALTRQEGVKILCSFVSRATGTLITDTLRNLSFYVDAKNIADWAIPYVSYAYDNDLMKGDNSNKFNPTDGLTREQALIIAQRMIVKYGWDK